MSKENCESEARKKIAASIGATPEEIYFTSGRADGHLKALKAVVKASKKARPHVIITTMEDPEVLDECSRLERKDAVVTYLDPITTGRVEVAVVDATGKVLDTVVIYPTAPQNKVEEAKKVVKALIKKYGITLISIGNGTASRESEQIVVDMLKEIKEPVQYVITNEAGASVYSASKLATEEFPNFDVGQRSATSIARRVQDPLAELVKIEPKAIGVGQYQHDMNQKQLTEALGGVVEATVNKVGVDLNTASASLLEYVSGVSKAVAKNIVAYREENGTFKNRKQL